jgi:DNA segregation ATPase FtsK/SpoIIIE, S-DNA-T family
MQGKNKQGPPLPLVAVAVLALAVVVRARWPLVVQLAHDALTLALIAAAVVVVALAVRVALLPAPARRNYPLAWLARAGWRSLTRNLSLAHIDQHQGDNGKRKVRHPRVRIRADEFGIVAAVKTLPKVGRSQFEDAADHLANAWRCSRVQVSQPKAGRLVVRGLRTDPLSLPLRDHSYRNDLPWRPYLGRDEWAADRYADLSGITGITVVGLPGYGKTSLILSLLDQLAGSAAVQFVFIDGKGGGDYRDWAPRAWLSTGDELDGAAAVLEDVHALMRRRLAAVSAAGTRNRWHIGPTEDYPLIVTVIDEAHTFYDLDAVKGSKEGEAQVRACRALSGQLIKKGRSVLFLTILITQKGTSDALPTALRDNCGLGFAFATKTRDGAVAGLGEAIKEWPSFCPTTLRDRSMIGVCTASLPSGGSPFVRLRVPEITEAAASARASATAHLRRDPAAVLEVVAEAPLETNFETPLPSELAA